MAKEFDYIRSIRKKIFPEMPMTSLTSTTHSISSQLNQPLSKRIIKHDHVVVGPGDDCAVLAPTARPLLVTKDILMDGIDFILSECGAVAAGKKALLCNLSDIAAMAGTPNGVMLGLCLPRLNGREIADGVFDGVYQIAKQYRLPIIGGDTNSWDHPLVISITLLGETHYKGPILRSGAKIGDKIFVTGPLGGSILGRHLTPTPRIREAIKLHDFYDIHSMLDISDGLVRDLGHICEESRVGAMLFADQIPIHDDAHRLAKKLPLDHALGDGEDFELLFTVEKSDAEKLKNENPTMIEIGEVVQEEGIWLVDSKGKRELNIMGWEHLL